MPAMHYPVRLPPEIVDIRPNHPILIQTRAVELGFQSLI